MSQCSFYLFMVSSWLLKFGSVQLNVVAVIRTLVV